MDIAAHFRKAPVELRMRGRVRGGIQLTLHPVTFQIHNHHVLGLELLIGHAGGLDDEQPLSRSMPDTFPQVKVTK